MARCPFGQTLVRPFGSSVAIATHDGNGIESDVRPPTYGRAEKETERVMNDVLRFFVAGLSKGSVR
jgi:hypothetical protein